MPLNKTIHLILKEEDIGSLHSFNTVRKSVRSLGTRYRLVINRDPAEDEYANEKQEEAEEEKFAQKLLRTKITPDDELKQIKELWAPVEKMLDRHRARKKRLRRRR